MLTQGGFLIEEGGKRGTGLMKIGGLELKGKLEQFVRVE